MGNLTNQYLADYVYLAEASYADFSKGYSTQQIILALTDQKENGGVEKPENFAKLVTDNYKVVAHYDDRTDESSFSGTLFQNKDTKQYVLALN